MIRLTDRKKILAGLAILLASALTFAMPGAGGLFGSPASPSATATLVRPVDSPTTPPSSVYIPLTRPEPVSVSSKPIPSQMLIRFAPQSSARERSTFIESLGGTVLQNIDALDTLVVSIPGQGPAQPLPASELVLESAPDYYLSALEGPASPNDPRYPEQWALPAISAPDAWAQLPADAATVTVALIDSGVCAAHADLSGRIGSGWDFIDNDPMPQDDYGHGCSVAGLMAATADDGLGIAGAAPNARLMPLRVLNASGIGSYSDVAAAIVYAADNGAQIINLSLGGPNPSSTLENAVNYALAKGVRIVAAAGNSGTQGALYPAAYQGVIAVGSLDPTMQPSSFSNYGTRIDVWAPGRDILTTRRDGGYGLVSGTSFAAPYVSAAQAVAMAMNQALPLAGAKLNMLAGVARDPATALPAAPGVTGADKPNLKAYAPAGWSAPVIVSSARGASASGALLTEQDIYISWSITNTGGDTSLPFKTCLNYDGLSLQCWVNDGLAAGAVASQVDWVLAIPTSAGAHRLELVTDAGNAIVESNKSDNVWAANFTWKAGSPAGQVSGDALVNDMRSSPALPATPQNINGSSAPGSGDTSDFMLGSITIGIVLPESSGSAENWTNARRDQVISKIQSGVNWWRQQAYNSYGITIPVQYDIHYAVPTTVEPVTLPSSSDGQWISDVMSAMGYNSGDKFARVNSYLNTLRAQRGTDWAIAFLVVDSTVDADGKFADGAFAYSYVGKSFTVMTGDNGGWTLSNMDKIAAHEMAHSFGAGDNYWDAIQGGCTSTTEPYGYLGIPNSNCMNGNSSAVINVLMNNLSWVLHSSTAQQVGWLDSDGDKLMNPVDTRPGIKLNPYLPNPANSAQLVYSGMAYDDPVPHYAYPAGSLWNYTQDVTINTITAVQYRVDGGAWTDVTAQDGSFNSDYEAFTFTTPVLANGKAHAIEVRTTNLAGNANSPLWSDSVLVEAPVNCFGLTRAHSGSGTDPSATPANSSGCPLGQYHAGETITLSATPGSGYLVGSWNGTDSSSSSASVTTLSMPASARAVTVNYVLNTQCYRLALSHSGSGTDPAATPANSSGCASGQYHAGQAISLLASPDAGYFVDHWSGAGLDASSAMANTLSMPAGAHSTNVTYALVPTSCFGLTLAQTGSGGAPSASPANSSGCPAGQYLAGEVISLTASPSGGYSVESWSGADSASTSNSNTVSMPAGPKTVTVNYSTYLLSCVDLAAQITPGASAGRVENDPAPNCAGGKYMNGTVVRLTAVPNPGYAFAGWGGSASGSASVTAITAAAGASVVAAFRAECYTLATAGSPALAGSVSVSPAPNCNGTQYSFGTPLLLTANPAAGYSVSGWSGTADDASKSNNINVNMPARAHSITASFAILPPGCHSLALASTGSGLPPTASPASSTGCPDGQYSAGQAISLQAFPASGYGVASWTGTGSDASTSTGNTLSMPAGAHTVTANYAALPVVCYQLTISASAGGGLPLASPANSSGCAAGHYSAGQAITLTAAPDPGNMLADWVGAYNDYIVSLSNLVIMPAAAQAVTVNYGAIPAGCFDLSLFATGSGAVPTASPSGVCGAGQYQAGELITLTAAPAVNNRVNYWSGTDNDAGVAVSNTLTMPAAAASVTVDYSATTPAVANDDIDNATVITAPTILFNVPVTTASSAGDDPVFPACDSDRGLQSVWYRVTAPALGELHIDTFGSSYDTLVALWSGTRGSLAMVDCSDDRVLYVDTWSEINAPVAAGVDYYIEVARYNAAYSAAGLEQVGKAPADPGALAVDTLSLNVSFTPVEPLRKGSIFDDTDSNIRYHENWNANNGSGPFQNSSHTTSVLGNSAWFAFEGKSFNLLYGTGPERGAADISIDNVWTASLNQFRASAQYQNQWSSPEFADGTHIVRITNRSDGKLVDIDAASTELIPPQNLLVSAASQVSLTLAWDDLSDNEAGFNIYRWGYNGAGWGFTSLDKVGVNATSYTQVGLDCGSDLNYYQVSAFNASGESTRTAWVQGATSPCSVVANDDFNAPRLAAPAAYSDTMQTVGATRALDDPQISACNLAAGAATVWYRFTAPSDGQLSLDTIGSDYDTVLALWSGERGSLAPLGCSDDRWASGSLIDRQSALKAGVRAGKVYAIEIGQFDGALAAGQGLAKPGAAGLAAGGSLSFHLAFTLPDLTVTNVTVSPGAPNANDNILANVTVQNISAVDAGGFYIDVYIDRQPTGCADWGGYYTWVGGQAANTSQIWQVKIPSGSLTTGAHTLYALANSGCGLSEGDQGNNRFGPVSFGVNPSPTAPAHDDIGSARLISQLPYTDSVDVSGATIAFDDPPVSLAGCDLAPGLASVWYRYTPGVNTRLNLDTFGSNFDTYLALWGGTRGQLTALACNNDTASGSSTLQSALVVDLNAGTTYYVEAAQWNGVTAAAALANLPPRMSAPTLTPGVAAQAGGTLVLHASVSSYNISGNAGVAGTTLYYTDGAALSVTADASGNYTLPVSYNWSGTVTPIKPGYMFTPASRTYANLIASKSAENYSAILTDTTPPAAITTLTAEQGGDYGSVFLKWYAVGDDGKTGTATSYEVRYSTSPITTESAWSAATPVTTGIPKLEVAYSVQSMTVHGLVRGQSYHFSVRALDEVPNRGGLSNSASAEARLTFCNNSMKVTGVQTKKLCGEGTISGYSGTSLFAGIFPRRPAFTSKTINISFVKGFARLCFSPYRGGSIWYSPNNGKTWMLLRSTAADTRPCVFISTSGLYAWSKK